MTVVLRGEGGALFGIVVERLGEIPVVPVADIAPMGNVFGSATSMLASVVMTHGGDNGPMLALLAVDRIAAMLGQAQ
jgi:chemotaxis signal transduction protein